MVTQHWDEPRAAVILGSARSMSTALAHCLDSHPQIGCEREEPLSQAMLDRWAWMAPRASRTDLVKLYLSRKGYHVSMCRLIYGQLNPDQFKVLAEMDARVLHLWRNPARVVASLALLHQRVKDQEWHTTHSFQGDVPARRVQMSAPVFVAQMQEVVRNFKAHWQLLEGLGVPQLKVKMDNAFEQGKEGWTLLNSPVDESIRSFLGIDDSFYSLGTQTKRINPQPLADIFATWEVLRHAAIKAGFGQYVEEGA